MKCCCCQRLGIGQPLPRGWKTCGQLVFCQECLHQRYRLRSITMPVAEPIGATWQELGKALEEAWSQATPLSIDQGACELTTAGGQHIVRVFIGNRWWTLRLEDYSWSSGRKAAFERIAFGQARAGEFLLYARPLCEGRDPNRPGGGPRAYEVECKTVAWIPRGQLRNPVEWQRTVRVRANRPDPGIRNQAIEDVDIGNLRGAIRENWVSFPAQVPLFPNCGQPNLQYKFVQLYFVMGWSCADIAARYDLLQDRVRGVLNGWKCRAAKAGYIQHIWPADGCAVAALRDAPVDEPAPRP